MFSSNRVFLLGLSGLALGIAVVACSSPTTRYVYGDPDGAAPETDSGTGGGFVTPDGGPPPVGPDGCSDQAKLVYVLSLEGDLYSFQPADKKFTKVGPLNCKSGGKTYIPISMAVDRKAVAWVNMRDASGLGGGEGEMFKVDTQTAACTPTNIKGFMGGMGFSTNAGSVDQETLFVIGQGSMLGKAALNKVDFDNERFVALTDLPEAVDLELTGTGDGRLYGFLISNPLALAAVDKASSAFSGRVSLSQVETPQSPMFAFSFWGGDFYFYTATDTSTAQTTNVTRYRPSDKSVNTSYMTDIGFHIVGAGVSTCAPTTGPK
jgi:hypothetical protein